MSVQRLVGAVFNPERSSGFAQMPMILVQDNISIVAPSLSAIKTIALSLGFRMRDWLGLTGGGLAAIILFGFRVPVPTTIVSLTGVLVETPDRLIVQAHSEVEQWSGTTDIAEEFGGGHSHTITLLPVDRIGQGQNIEFSALIMRSDSKSLRAGGL